MSNLGERFKKGLTDRNVCSMLIDSIKFLLRCIRLFLAAVCSKMPLAASV
jgi:hypothetical protein